MGLSDPHPLLVLGASAGGVEALSAIAAALPEDLPAAVAVVLHVPPWGTSVLPEILDRAGPLPAVSARDGMQLEPGRLHVAPPDRHLLIADGRIALGAGPRENGHRPAVDALFGSAARAYGPRVAGVVLTGALDDGTAGLGEIKLRGGAAVVQDPDDALYRGMPDSALARVRVDVVAPLAELPRVLTALARGAVDMEARMTGDGQPHLPGPPAPGGDLAAAPDMPEDRALGLSCPECGGALWQVGERSTARVRCRIGHVYSDESLLAQHGESVETALWTALRALEERSALLQRMNHRAAAGGHDRSAARFAEHAADVARQAEVIRAQIIPRALDAELQVAAEP